MELRVSAPKTTSSEHLNELVTAIHLKIFECVGTNAKNLFPSGARRKKQCFYLLVEIAFDFPITSCCLNGLVTESCSTGSGEYFQCAYLENTQNGFKSHVQGQLKMGSVTHTARKGGNSQMTERKD